MNNIGSFRLVIRFLHPFQFDGWPGPINVSCRNKICAPNTVWLLVPKHARQIKVITTIFRCHVNWAFPCSVSSKNLGRRGSWTLRCHASLHSIAYSLWIAVSLIISWLVLHSTNKPDTHGRKLPLSLVLDHTVPKAPLFAFSHGFWIVLYSERSFWTGVEFISFWLLFQN